MSKEKTILRINKYGKIGKIIAIIMLVVIGLSIISTIASAIFLRMMPKDLMVMNVNNSLQLTVDPSVVDGDIDSADINTDEVVNAINTGKIDAGFNLGIASYKFNHAEIIDNKLIATSNVESESITFESISNALFIAVITLIFSFVSVWFACRLCKSIEKCDTPFSEDVIKKMRHFAFSLIPWALLTSLPEQAINSAFGNNLNIGLGIDLNVIFTVLVILAISAIFKYGAVLQQESDETL